MENAEILIVRKPFVTLETVALLAQAWHGTLLKGVADCTRKVIALGGEWHMDANTVLIADGSSQADLWGFNLYPEEVGDSTIEYISLINIRPAQGNTSMELQNNDIKKEIRAIVARLIPDLGL